MPHSSEHSEISKPAVLIYSSTVGPRLKKLANPIVFGYESSGVLGASIKLVKVLSRAIRLEKKLDRWKQKKNVGAK